MKTFNASFKVAGTISFRLASSKFLTARNEEGYGGNLQNIPDNHRRFFVPRPGYVFIQDDLEGAEAVVVALLCAEGMFRDLIRRKVKPHNFVCIKLFPSLFKEHLTEQEIEHLTPNGLADHPNYKAVIKLCKNLPREYALAKRTVHGANYQMGWKTFQENVLKETAGDVVLTAKESKRLLETYFELFPEVKAFQAHIDNAVRHGETLFNLFNHPFTPIVRYSTSAVRQAVSWIPQSTVGQCSNIGAIRLQERIEKENLDINILNVVHDSILAECRESSADITAQLIADCLTFSFKSPIDGWTTTIGVEKQIGRNWGKYHETENPAGMKVI